MEILTIFVFYFAIVFITANAIDVHLECNANGFQCANETAFIVCVEIGENLLVPSPVVENCPLGFICAENLEVPCVEIKSTTTTPIPPTQWEPPFQCKKSGKYPGPTCDQYYQCVDLIFWYKLKLKTCPKNQWFNKYSQKCVSQKKSQCVQYLPVYVYEDKSSD